MSTRPLFMIDIETTGIDPDTNDLLQIGIVSAKFAKDGYWHKNRTFQILQHTDKTPQSAFAKEHMADLFKRCNEAKQYTPEDIRKQILSFCHEEIGRPDRIRFMGWNAAIFDLPFLVNKKVLEPPGYKTVNGKDEMIGDFHYHVYDMNGALDIVMNIMKEDSIDKVKELVGNMNEYPKYDLPKDAKEHDAVYDCLSQLNFLNGVLRLFQKVNFKPPIL